MGQVHSKKVALIEPKMVPAVPKRKITHALKLSAQSEHLCGRYSKFDCFLKIVCISDEAS